MRKERNEAGFSLIEILLVLAILGIISGIAIPSFMGQRKRARVIGDARSNAQVLSMMLETRRADFGTYGTTGSSYDWKADGSATSGPTLVPQFTPKGNSQMDFNLVVANNGLSYTLTVRDPQLNNATVLTSDQTGTVYLDTIYNK